MPFYGLHRSFHIRVPGKDIVSHPEYIIGEPEAQVVHPAGRLARGAEASLVGEGGALGEEG